MACAFLLACPTVSLGAEKSIWSVIDSTSSKGVAVFELSPNDAALFDSAMSRGAPHALQFRNADRNSFLHSEHGTEVPRKPSGVARQFGQELAVSLIVRLQT